MKEHRKQETTAWEPADTTSPVAKVAPGKSSALAKGTVQRKVAEAVPLTGPASSSPRSGAQWMDRPDMLAAHGFTGVQRKAEDSEQQAAPPTAAGQPAAMMEGGASVDVLGEIERATADHARLLGMIEEVNKRLQNEKPSPAFLQTWQQFSTYVRQHMQQEEAEVFPGVKAGNSVQAPLQEMAGQHRTISQLVVELRGMIDQAGSASGPLTALLEAVDIHAFEEDRQLLPAAR